VGLCGRLRGRLHAAATRRPAEEELIGRIQNRPHTPREAVYHSLRHGPLATRLETARLLRRAGPSAVEPLCFALRDRDLAVRIAAAESLGQVGDARAVQPLMEALRDSFIGRSGWQHLFIGGLMVVATILLLLLCMATAILTLSIDPFSLSGSSSKSGDPQSAGCPQSALRQAVIRALVHIAERHPAPELRDVLPDLKAMALDVLQQEAGTRAASRDAARRIDALTEKLKSLPVPASMPAMDASELPRPAGAPSADAKTLPRVR